MNNGWIKIHRQIVDHWIYNEKRKFSKFEAWQDILLTVNFLPGKSIIKGKLIEVNRGESILSLDSWSKRWSWDKSSVKRFLELLQKDGMIIIKNETVTTRITVCNYESYQGEDSKNETQTKHKRNADETQTKLIKEGKKNKEEEEENIDLLEKEPKEKRFNFKAALLQENFDPKLVEDWIKVRKVKRAANTETSFKMFLNQIHEAERRFHKDRNELLELTVSRSWQTFKVEYIENLNSQNGSTKQQPANTISREDGKQLAIRRALGID